MCRNWALLGRCLGWYPTPGQNSFCIESLHPKHLLVLLNFSTNVLKFPIGNTAYQVPARCSTLFSHFSFFRWLLWLIQATFLLVVKTCLYCIKIELSGLFKPLNSVSEVKSNGSSSNVTIELSRLCCNVFKVAFKTLRACEPIGKPSNPCLPCLG